MDWRKYFWSKFLSGPVLAEITWEALPAGDSGVSLYYSRCPYFLVSFFPLSLFLFFLFSDSLQLINMPPPCKHKHSSLHLLKRLQFTTAWFRKSMFASMSGRVTNTTAPSFMCSTYFILCFSKHPCMCFMQQQICYFYCFYFFHWSNPSGGTPGFKIVLTVVNKTWHLKQHCRCSLQMLDAVWSWCVKKCSEQIISYLL